MIKFQVWSPVKLRWRTAYCRDRMHALVCAVRFMKHGFKIRVEGKEYSNE